MFPLSHSLNTSDKTNATHESTDAQRRTATEEPPKQTATDKSH